MFGLRFLALIRAIAARQWWSVTAYSAILLSVSGLIWALGTRSDLFAPENLTVKATLAMPGNPMEWWMMVATAVLIPIFWQFVDLSNWQRICALSTTDRADYRKEARRGLKDYLVESPLSWLLPLLLGLVAPFVVANIAKDEPFENLVRFFLQIDGSWQIVGVLFCAAVVGIFMSTAACCLTAVGYAFVYDLWAPSRRIVDKQNPTVAETQEAIRAGRWFMTLVTIAVVGIFVAVDVTLGGGSAFLGLLFSFYTPLVALSPAVIVPILTTRKAQASVTAASIVAGASVGIVLGILSAVVRPELQWYPGPVAFVVSWLIYLIGFAVSRSPHSEVGRAVLV